VPDRHVKLVRFDAYAARSEPPSGAAGKREALADEIYFYPVSQVATRTAGCRAATTTSPMPRPIRTPTARSRKTLGSCRAREARRLSDVLFNKKQGLMANEKLRQAVLLALDMQRS